MYDTIIIGAGPSGLTSAIYLARGGLKVLIVERNYAGGQMLETNEIENYPGFRLISGYELANNMLEQAEALGVEILYGEGEFDLENLTVKIDGEVKRTRSIILAVGATHKNLGLEDEDKLIGRGISYCATCDGAFYKGKTVAVVGGGNTALQDAIYLSKFAKTVHLIHRREQFRGSSLLQDKVKSSNVVIHTPYTVKSLGTEDGKLSSITLMHRDGGEEELPVDGLFVAVGQVPQTEGFKVEKDGHGYIKTNEKMRTSTSGVWAIGDCRDKSLRQIVTATSDGAIAGEDIIEFLSK